MQTVHVLESKGFLPGGNLQFSMRDLPSNKRIRALMLRFEGTFTQAATGAQAVNGDDLCMLFQRIGLGRRVQVTGKILDRMNWMMRGVQSDLPAQIPATAGAVFRRVVTVMLPFADFNALSPYDCAPNTGFFRTTPLIVDTAPTSLFPSLTIAGTIRASAMLDDVDDGVVPSIAQFGFQDATGSTLFLDKGLYTHLIIMKDGPGNDLITTQELSLVTLASDGATVIPGVTPQELVALADYFGAQGGARQSESPTAPIPGEQLTDSPDPGAGATGVVSMEYVPLITQAPGYQLSRCLNVQNQLRIDTQGTGQIWRLVYRRIEGRTAAQAVKALRASGVAVPNLAATALKTASKTTPSVPTFNRLAPFLPLRQNAPTMRVA